MTYWFNEFADSCYFMKKPGPGFFDARAFNIPDSDVCNYFIWRSKDMEHNSLSMLAQSLYSHKQLKNKKRDDLHELCFQAGHNWNHLETYKKRGSCIIYKDEAWQIDNEIPIFSQNRSYIERLLVRNE